MPRIQLCRVDELEDIDARGFELTQTNPAHDIFIVRNYDNIAAYQNSCPHNHGPLNWLEDAFLSDDKEYIQCVNHGALFELDSGHCIYGPCNGQSLTRIDVEIDDHIIYVVI